MRLPRLLLAALGALALAPAAALAGPAAAVQVVAPDGRPLVRALAQAGYAYPADGSVVQVADALAAGGRLELRGVSLLGGRIAVATASVGAQATLDGLTVDGLALPAGENGVVPIPDVGYLVTLQQAVIPYRDGGVRRTAVALRLHLSAAYGELPAGTEILVGHAVGSPGAARLVGAAAEIPGELVPIFRAAGRRYGVPWSVLAAINRVETSFGRDVRRSSAGAVGWMQFMPATWGGYGHDADGDGRADPNDPEDAIFSAARLLAANGAARDLAGAVWLYNHSDRYVRTVLDLARAYAEGAAAEPPRVEDARRDETPGFDVVSLF